MPDDFANWLAKFTAVDRLCAGNDHTRELLCRAYELIAKSEELLKG
jgi:hypothetical protein